MSDKERFERIEKMIDSMSKAITGLGNGFIIHNDLLKVISEAMTAAATQRRGPLN